MMFEQRLKHLHDEAHEVAFSYYIRKGFVPPRLLEVMEVTSSVKAFIDYTFKFNPDQPRIPAGNPDGGQWTSGDGGGNGALTDGITPVYPLETAIMLFFGGLSAVGDALGGAAEGAIGEGVDALAADAETVTQSLVDYLAPNGAPIGNAGTSPWIRELPGGSDAAEQMFQGLTKGGTLDPSLSYSGIRYFMPDGSYVGYRPISESGPPTIDLNIPSFGKTLQKLKFVD
jgi:hypothetical protein